ncbi:MAG: hypothetical protein RLY29_440 [Actinomycetota bacterium]
MLQVLRTAFTQASRSIILILLLVGFIALITWATAGSSSGNTADPLRAALWFFLVAHQVPLQLTLSDATISGTLSFLPIGALLVAVIAVKSGYERMVATIGESNNREKRRNVIAFAGMYSIIGYLISLLGLGDTVTVPFYIGVPVIFLVATAIAYLVSGLLPRHNLQFPWQRALKVAWILIIGWIGFGSLILAASMIWHFELLVNLTRVVEPGFFGGLVLLLVQILYLPNLALSVISFISGAGISLGAGSLLSPFIHRIDEIPAIPILGALPASRTSLLFLFAILFLLTGALIAKYGSENYSDWVEQKRFLISAIGFIALLSFVAARGSSGQLLSENLPSVGPIWWAMPLLLAVEVAIGITIYLKVPPAIEKLRNRGK